MNSESIKKKVLPALERNNDYIIINTTCRDYKNIGSKVYTSAVQLFVEQIMQMTILGATIIKSSVVKEIIKKIPNEKGKTYGLWQPMSMFHYIADKRVRAESIVDDIWIYNTLAAKSSFWGKNTLKQWCDMWCDMINNLPSIYDAYKQNAMYIYMTDFQPFYAKNLLSIRANGGLSFSEINKCKEKLKYVCNTPVKVFYIIACVPSSVAKFLIKNNESIVYKIIKYIYFIIFGIVPGEKEIIE